MGKRVGVFYLTHINNLSAGLSSSCKLFVDYRLLSFIAPDVQTPPADLNKYLRG